MAAAYRAPRENGARGAARVYAIGMTTEGQGPRHFSMLRSFQLADLFTIANGACGVAAIFRAMRYVSTGHPRDLWYAAVLVPIAIVFDVLDGRIARWRREASPLGRELDSLADVISFGVAPAAIAFAAGLDGPLDQVLLVWFAACGLSRLARYNITAAAQVTGPADKVPYYEGTPITTSIVPLGVVILAWSRGSVQVAPLLGGSLHALSLMFLVSGCLMISKTIRIPKP